MLNSLGTVGTSAIDFANKSNALTQKHNINRNLAANQHKIVELLGNVLPLNSCDFIRNSKYN